MPFLRFFFLLLGAPIFASSEPVANLFVHPLIAWPEKAFATGNRDVSRMDEWFITVDEFKRALTALEARGYMLVSASAAYADHQLQPLQLPPGKKPLLLSIDDLNYYTYMKSNGTVSRLLVDNDRLMARTFLPGGRFRDDADKEVMQVLEQFVAEHPGFSFQGARGLIAVTGYAGLFGWHTQWAGPQLAEAKKQARAVADKLKKMGWEFASHSYAHRSQAKQPFAEWKASEVRWDNEVAPLIGATPYYVFPFGEKWWARDDRWKVLKNKGYQVFFGVDKTSTLAWKDNLPILGRVPLDGRGLRSRFGLLSPFFDPADVFDAARPATIKY